MKFELEGKQEFITLTQLLKTIGLVESGGQAHSFIEDGMVLVNNQVEYRKRAKLRKGDIIEFNNEEIEII